VTLAHWVGVLYRGELCETGLVEVYSPPFIPTRTCCFGRADIESGAGIARAVRSDVEPNVRQKHSACPFADRCPWKVGSICDDVPPPWQTTSNTHALRCHIPLSELQQREVWSPLAAPEGEPLKE
jgi:peptide/nickel transport system ATP-binding protein